MNLRLKLTLSYLVVSLFTTLAVGSTAWWMLSHEFRDAIRERSFANFREDLVRYVERYGSWEEAQRQEAFTSFVLRMRRPPHPPPGAAEPFPPDMPPEWHGDYPPPPFPDAPAAALPPDHQPLGSLPRSTPPFHFMLLSPEGTVLRDVAGHAAGSKASPELRAQAVPVEVGGRTVLLAVPIGEVRLSNEDQAYIHLMQQALLAGMLVSLLVAGLLGVLFGNRLSAALRELVQALQGMRADGEVPAPVPVRSRDEVGLLAATFNRMSRLLLEAHQELKKSHTTIRTQAEQLREQSLRDALTGLHNRRYFDRHAADALERARRGGHPLCVMQADLDHFKHINDGYSHAVGDEVLRRTAELLRSQLRSTDIVARYGGEEFVAVFVDADLAAARQKADALRQSIEQAPWEDVAPGLRVTLSAGLCADTALGNLDAMLRAADALLYRAKERGRNRVEAAPA